MPDGLYDSDVLAWSEQQAELLRRLARGEMVNDVDWDNVIEEIESVGRSELHSVESCLRQMMVHLLKVHAWPQELSVRHWRSEIGTFQSEAQQRFTPSMRQLIDLDRLFRRASRDFALASRDIGQVGGPLPPNAFALDDLLNADPEDLLRQLSPASDPAP